MYTKQNLIDSVANEFRILKHLTEKIPAGTEGYKPTEGQRTTLELLQYLSHIFVSATQTILAGAYDPSAPRADTSGVTIANFPEMLDAQFAEFSALMEKFDDAELEKVINIYGMGEKTKGVYLVENLLKWLGAYKTQLFLYIKASGNTSLGTSNLWGGVDMPQA